ncbi:hypothetical protein F5Y05DRAFT_28750 [Hypoxylon sp. FL0543]|nr:hypothetical protein F5Y05DRAFT_28750 [Hypoxylon sp. FL0543]
MMIQYDNDSASMEFSTVQRKVAVNPLRTLQPQSSQLNIGRLSSTICYGKAEGTFHRPYMPEPPYSPISDRSGASFSQVSGAEPWDIVPTEISPPQTPKSKEEPDDALRLDLVPPRVDALKREGAYPEEDLKDTKPPQAQLPSVYRFLPAADHETRRRSSLHSTRNFLKTPSSSPEPSDGYALSTNTTLQPPTDPIVRWLNLRRQECGKTKDPLSQPRGLGKGSCLDINLDFGNTTPVFYRQKQQYTPQPRNLCHRPRLQSSPPRDVAKKGRAKAKDAPHNNIKYTLEESDYIRFNKYEMKLSWDENKEVFRQKFPMADTKLNREVQGIQGLHYRDNQHVPHLLDRGRKLVFLDNGHVAAVDAKVRAQRENKPYYSLHYLYPERAILYDWVPEKYKLVAAELIKERIPQREAARRKAMALGIWQEKLETGECACCPKPDRERDSHKRSAASPSSDDGDLAVPIKRQRSAEPRRSTPRVPYGAALYPREHPARP